MTRRLIMLRHGQTDYNATRRMQGHLNTKLSPVGFEQAAAAADFLTNKNIIKIVSSDLDRAFDTATVIGQRLNLPVEKDERLRETQFRPVAVPLPRRSRPTLPRHAGIMAARVRHGHPPVANPESKWRAGPGQW